MKKLNIFHFVVGLVFMVLGGIATQYNFAVITWICAIIGMTYLSPFIVLCTDEIELRLKVFARRLLNRVTQ